MRSIHSVSVLLALFLAASASAEYGQYPGATWERHAYDRSGSFDHNRQCDENGCLITNTREQHARQVDQYYVPNAPQQQNYYRPQTTAPNIDWSRHSKAGGGRPAADYGPNAFYWDENNNPISYAQFRQMNAAYAAHYGTTAPAPPQQTVTRGRSRVKIRIR